MAIGVANTFGLTTPTGACTNNSSNSEGVGLAEVLTEGGDIKHRRPKKLITSNVSISGKGDADFSVVTTGSVAVDVVKVTEVTSDETNDGEWPDFSVSGVKKSNLA